MLTASAQLEGPVGDLSFAADTAESYPWKQDLGEASPLGIATRHLAREAVIVVGAITPWNFRTRSISQKLGPAAHRRLKPAPNTWCAAALEVSRRAHRLPTGRCQHHHLSSRFGGAGTQDPRVDMISFTSFLRPAVP